MITALISWGILGLLAGYAASTLTGDREQGFAAEAGLGVVGAILGGWLFNAFSGTGATGANFWSLTVAMAGAMGCLIAWHAIRRLAWHS